MSFLTYTSHPILFAASVGGVTLGVTLLLLPWKQISFGDSWSNSFLSSRGINSLSNRGPIERENNCKVVSGLEKVIRPLANSSDYIAISCNNTGMDSDTYLVGKWTGLFHRNLFKVNKDYLVDGFLLNINTITEETYHDEKEEEKIFLYTRFKSKQFSKGDIKGIWEYGELYIDEKIIDVVYLDDPYSSERIYFVHGSKKR